MAKKTKPGGGSVLPEEVRRISLPPRHASDIPRRSRRHPIAGVLVEIEVPTLSDKPWVVDAVDINADGMGLVLPHGLEPGTHVLLSFRLDSTCEFSRVPAVLLHQEPQAGGGGVRFGAWSDADRLRLLEHLVRIYEGTRRRTAKAARRPARS
ncbi:MAG: PilZ domain-containing protein [Acidobacteriota bacterium]